MKIEERIAELGIELPAASVPAAMYVPLKQVGNAIFVSGQIPTKDGKLLYTGHVGDEVTMEQAEECAERCIINMLAGLKNYLGDLDKVVSIVKLQAFVNSAADFSKQHIVVNAASKLLFEVFGEAGRHARTAVGVNTLPMGAPVEIEAIVEI